MKNYMEKYKRSRFLKNHMTAIPIWEADADEFLRDNGLFDLNRKVQVSDTYTVRQEERTRIREQRL